MVCDCKVQSCLRIAVVGIDVPRVINRRCWRVIAEWCIVVQNYWLVLSCNRNDAYRPGSWLSLGKHIHNDHVAGLVVHNEVERVSSYLVGIEVHGVIAGVELICVVLRTGCAGLNHLIEACGPSNRCIGDKL